MINARDLLVKRGNDLKECMVQLAENVHEAVNYTVSTVSMIESQNGIILIDAGLDAEDCARIMTEFKKITQKPIIAVIYTHGHPDHTMGIWGFLPKGNDDNKVQIWGRSNFNAENKQFKDLAPIFGKRGARQGGFLLAPEQRINNGIAPVRFPKTPVFKADAKPIAPNHTFSEEMITINIDGITLELHAASGETADQLFVWYPEKEILFCGDNMYRSFPNLYAVRGSGYRDVREWIHSLEKMMDLGAKRIALGHTLPVIGEKECVEFIRMYHEAIKFVYDKSIEGMNLGLTIDELAEYVKLPEHLANQDALLEFYGNVAWSVRSIFVGHLGWFDGNARNLMPLEVKEEAEKMAQLVGGKEALLEKAKEALSTKELGNAKWAAKLLDYCLYLDMPVQALKADALDIMAEHQLTATGRNYIFTEAKQLREKAKK